MRSGTFRSGTQNKDIGIVEENFNGNVVNIVALLILSLALD